MAETGGDVLAEAGARLQLGRALFWLGSNYAAAQAELERARILAAQGCVPAQDNVDDVNDWVACRTTQANSLYELARVLRRQRRYEEAQACNSEALDIFRQMGDAWSISQVLEVMSQIHWHLRDHAQAIAARDEAMRILRALGDNNSESNMLANLGELYDYVGDYRQADEVLQRSLQLSLMVSHDRSHAEILGNLGRLHLHLGQFDHARGYLSPA